MYKIDEIWNYYYNYSSMRHGLFSWYDFRNKSEILEWNPENGALTQILSKKSQSVTCIADNVTHQRILEKRFSNISNVSVITLQKFKIQNTNKYDYIIAVNPFSKNIKNNEMSKTYDVWNALLKKEGKLLLIINNVLALQKSIGIRNVYRKEVDKLSLRNALNSVFQNVKFYYVYPDYIFPQVIYSDKVQPNYGVVERIISYARNINEVIEDDQEIYRTAANNNMLVDMANSFFVECTQNGELANVLYATITAERENYALSTLILEEGTVEKRPLDYRSAKQIKGLALNLNKLKLHNIDVVPFELMKNSMKMPYIQAPTLIKFLKNIIVKDICIFLEVFEEFYLTILKSSEHVDEKDNILLNKYGQQGDWGPILSDAYIEMTPLNCFYDHNTFIFFDQEYVFHNYPAKYMIYRSLSHLYYTDDVFQNYIPLIDMKKKYELIELWEFFEREEQIFLYNVRGRKKNQDFYETLSLNNTLKYGRPMSIIKKVEMLEFLVKCNKKIVIWGAGNYFEKFMDNFEFVLIDFAVDSNPELWNTFKRGIKILNPTCLKGGDAFVIIACKSPKSIIDVLVDFGISNYKIFELED